MPVGAEDGDLLVRIAMERTQASRDWPGLCDPLPPPGLGPCGWTVTSHMGAADTMGGCLYKPMFQEWKVVSVPEVGLDRGECHLSQVPGGQVRAGCMLPCF